MRFVKALLYSLAFVGIYIFMQLIFSIIFLIPMMFTPANLKAIQDFNTDVIINLSTIATVYSLPFCIIATFFIYVLIFKLRRISFKKALYLNKVKPSTILLSIGFSICFYPLISMLADFLTKFYPSFDMIQNTFSDMFRISVPFSILYICFMGPIMEEIITRGLVFNEIKISSNFIIAILIQALLFGAMHLNMVQGIYAFVLGVTYGIFREKFNSLIIAFVCHIVNNSYSIFLSYLPEQIVNKYLLSNAFTIISIVLLVAFSVMLYFNYKKHYKQIYPRTVF
ncbi:MAG: CPBP family intramembrane metalloprotease [Oscillospiraceae bacterium]|nr:CPBP family intramembrane metalloprotease [Oscillospiraceae bacterium]